MFPGCCTLCLFWKSVKSRFSNKILVSSPSSSYFEIDNALRYSSSRSINRRWNIPRIFFFWWLWSAREEQEMTDRAKEVMMMTIINKRISIINICTCICSIVFSSSLRASSSLLSWIVTHCVKSRSCDAIIAVIFLGKEPLNGEKVWISRPDCRFSLSLSVSRCCQFYRIFFLFSDSSRIPYEWNEKFKESKQHNKQEKVEEALKDSHCLYSSSTKTRRRENNITPLIFGPSVSYLHNKTTGK